MPYITRQDGERFIIPSYRDVLSAKKSSLFKKEILLLAQNYGEYAVLLRKGIAQYEVAFSSESGYLLGETVWHHFQRPANLIYCESIPNTQEVILIVVKSNSVYLDGRFPRDSIPDELIGLKTQANAFNIIVYGDVPISPTPEEGKFSLDPALVKSFRTLDHSAFEELPTLKNFQLQLVDTVLKSHGIGVFPTRMIVGALAAMGFIWVAWIFISMHQKELPAAFVGVVNPYQVYLNTLTSPDPVNEIQALVDQTNLLFTLPGWHPDAIFYSKGQLRASAKSVGTRGTIVLLNWAKKNNFNLEIMSDGFYLTKNLYLFSRSEPTSISVLNTVITSLINRLSYVLPGNNLSLGAAVNHSRYSEMDVTINFTKISPVTLNLIGQQLNTLPIVLTSISVKNDQGYLTGSIMLKALGN